MTSTTYTTYLTPMAGVLRDYGRGVSHRKLQVDVVVKNARLMAGSDVALTLTRHTISSKSCHLQRPAQAALGAFANNTSTSPAPSLTSLLS